MQQNQLSSMLLPQEQAAVDKMIGFHSDMGKFFKSDTQRNQMKIDQLFIKLITLKKLHILSMRKMNNSPALTEEDARNAVAVINRLGQGFQPSNMSIEQQVINMVNQRRNERSQIMREMRNCKDQFDGILQQYESSLSATPAYQQLKRESEIKQKQLELQKQKNKQGSDVNVGASTSGTNGSKTTSNKTNGHSTNGTSNGSSSPQATITSTQNGSQLNNGKKNKKSVRARKTVMLKGESASRSKI